MPKNKHQNGENRLIHDGKSVSVSVSDHSSANNNSASLAKSGDASPKRNFSRFGYSFAGSRSPRLVPKRGELRKATSLANESKSLNSTPSPRFAIQTKIGKFFSQNIESSLKKVVILI